MILTEAGRDGTEWMSASCLFVVTPQSKSKTTLACARSFVLRFTIDQPTTALPPIASIENHSQLWGSCSFHERALRTVCVSHPSRNYSIAVGLSVLSEYLCLCSPFYAFAVCLCSPSLTLALPLVRMYHPSSLHPLFYLCPCSCLWPCSHPAFCPISPRHPSPPLLLVLCQNTVA